MDTRVTVSRGIVDESDEGTAKVTIGGNVEAGTKIDEVIDDGPIFRTRETKGEGSTRGVRVDALANNSIGKVHRGANLRRNVRGVKSTNEKGGRQQGLIGIVEVGGSEVRAARESICGM